MFFSTRHFLLGISAVLFTKAVSASQIDFQINGIKQAEGKLYIQLFKGENAYKTGDALVATVVSPKDKSSATVQFNDIEPGEYAVRFFHDENNNGKLETNLFGLPTEGYGFSNNAKPNFGPVSYEEIMFVVDSEQVVTINSTDVIY